MSMKTEGFGKTSEGKEAVLYTFTNKNNTSMSVSDYGATLVSVVVEDKERNLCDVVLGYDNASGYEKGGSFFGAIVGRNANRIGSASFELNGKEYKLEKNDNENNLHSGLDFYSKRMWNVEKTEEDSITLSLLSEDGDQGYPGNVKIEVTYTLTDENEVVISYQATPDADTILNLTNHSYFNLDGHASGSILKQKIWLDAEEFTRADHKSIPTGELVRVEGTPMDFNEMKEIGRDIETKYEALELGKGYDHNWVLKNAGEYTLVGEMVSFASGIHMEVYTDLPGIQIYSGNFITEDIGKNGAHYKCRQGVCFETQYFPDAIHKENFMSPVCKKGDTYRTKTAYKFHL